MNHDVFGTTQYTQLNPLCSTFFSLIGLELEKGIYEKTKVKATTGSRGIYVNHAVIVVKKLREEVGKVLEERRREEEARQEAERLEEAQRQAEKEKELADAAMARQLAAEEEAKAKEAGTWKPKHADPATRECFSFSFFLLSFSLFRFLS